MTTTYIRDRRGLELERKEAVGRPEERTVTTVWHPAFRLPETITEPGRRTTFGYDGQGRLLTRTQTDTVSGAARTTTPVGMRLQYLIIISTSQLHAMLIKQSEPRETRGFVG